MAEGGRIQGLVQGLRARKPGWRKGVARGLVAVAGLVAIFLLLPVVTFPQNFSAVALGRDGTLLSARIAEDEQWRFPPLAHVPDRYKAALLHFEDRRFAWHPGVDPIAVARALRLNLKHGRVVSGASTITMQVVRLARGAQERTLWEKLIESVLALRMELSLSKDEILGRYTSYAPMGGNVVGLHAAAWRYFGRPPQALSWAESALFAILPNSPGLIHMGRNRQDLLQKRNRLLLRLHEDGLLDAQALALAQSEPLPPPPKPFPRLANLAINTAALPGKVLRTTLDPNLQAQAEAILERSVQTLAGRGIHNAAAIIADTRSGEVLVYVGNHSSTPEHASFVDIARAPRSTGSILKPLLYGMAMEHGELLPNQFLKDVPTRIGGFAPENFDRGYSGAVSASAALARSLNVPAVRLLADFGVGRFHGALKDMGMSTLGFGPDHYGLSLVIGGAEGTLWDMVGIYASVGRALLKDGEGFHPLTMDGELKTAGPYPRLLEPATVWPLVEAMQEVRRPGADGIWRRLQSPRHIAWKTGTSHGFRDAWAIGMTPSHTIGVWAGNADGEGRAGLTGFGAAAPILFDLIELIPRQAWFSKPEGLVEIEVCAHSGLRAGPHCAQTRLEEVPKAALGATGCPYCETVHCDATCTFRVDSACANVADIRHEKWFVLPANMGWFYGRRHASYRPLPPIHPQCIEKGAQDDALGCLYPRDGAEIYVPRELGGTQGRVVFEAAHRDTGATVFWHLDEVYLGDTRTLHQMAVSPAPGEHVLTLVDDAGRQVQRRFVVLSKGRAGNRARTANASHRAD